MLTGEFLPSVSSASPTHVSEFFPAKPVLHTEPREAREPIDAASALSHARIRRL